MVMFQAERFRGVLGVDAASIGESSSSTIMASSTLKIEVTAKAANAEVQKKNNLERRLLFYKSELLLFRTGMFI